MLKTLFSTFQCYLWGKSSPFPCERKNGGNVIKIEKSDNSLLKSAEIIEILINYAEELIDLATELQYILVERYGIQWGDNDSKQKSILQQEMPILPICGGKEERTQNSPQETNTSLSVQKVYVPVFRLSANNTSTTAANNRTQAQRNSC